jgi:hypothetical protein
MAQGSLEELRTGVQARDLSASAMGDQMAGADSSAGEKLTLEQIFLRIVGGARLADQELSWLG